MTEQSLPHQEQPTKILTFITILIHKNSFLVLFLSSLKKTEQYTFERIIFTKYLIFSLKDLDNL